MNREEIIQLSNSYRTAEDRTKLKQFFSGQDHLSPERNTIIFSSPGETGTSYFRIFEPMLSIYRATDEFNLVYTEQIQPWHYNLASMIVLHRAGDLHDATHTVMNLWPAEKVRPFLIHNVDDNETILPKTHPLYWAWKSSNRDKQSMRSIRECDAVEITTHKLKQFMSNHNKHAFVTRNYFNWQLPQWNLNKKGSITNLFTEVNKERVEKEKFSFDHYDFPESWKDKIVIGWAGLTSHFEDIKKMVPILKALHDKYPNAVFVLAGMALKDTMMKMERDANGKIQMKGEEEMPDNLKYKNRVSDLFKEFDPERLRIWNALQLEEYGWFYSVMDLGIAFIEHNTFNSCKSEIKAVEYMKYGAIPVFSNYGGYTDLMDIMRKEGFTYDEVQTITCNSEFNAREWSQKLGTLIENFGSDAQTQFADRLKSFVERYYDIDQNTIMNRLGLYKGFIESNIEKQEQDILRLQYDFVS